MQAGTALASEPPTPLAIESTVASKNAIKPADAVAATANLTRIVQGVRDLIASSPHVDDSAVANLTLFGANTGESLQQLVSRLLSRTKGRVTASEKMLLEIMRQLKVRRSVFARKKLEPIWRKLSHYKKQNNASMRKKIRAQLSGSSRKAI